MSICRGCGAQIEWIKTADCPPGGRAARTSGCLCAALENLPERRGLSTEPEGVKL